jgi:hypothetical protein
VTQVIDNGYRTGDICGPVETSVRKVGTIAMGDAIAAAIG